jgi:hypothetical protein
MVSGIDVIETIEDKKSWFNVKRFNIGGNHFEKPEKCLDIKTLDQATYRSLKDGFKFYEATKIVGKYSNLVKLYNSDDDQGVDNFFYKKDWLSGAPNVINFTFEFNPFLYVRSMDDMSWFFNQYYPYSRLILTVPNIRIRRTVFKKVVPIIGFEDYIRFVDAAFKILNDKNNKPIFVPVSMRMGIRKLTELIEHYLKEEHYYFWFDFEGQPISERSLGRLRHVFDTVKKSENFDRVVSYFTNIKREKLANSNELTSVASDALCAVAGANLIGVNREPQRYKPKTTSEVSAKEELRAPTPVDPNHKARIFDRETYYYVKTNNADLFPKNKYVPVNAARLNAEFATQSEYFLENLNIDTLLNQKIVFKDEKAGNVLKELTSKPTGSGKPVIGPDLTDFLN